MDTRLTYEFHQAIGFSAFWASNTPIVRLSSAAPCSICFRAGAEFAGAAFAIDILARSMVPLARRRCNSAMNVDVSPGVCNGCSTSHAEGAIFTAPEVLLETMQLGRNRCSVVPARLHE